jgi:acetyl/propionyl-CoA carboxylase alpha subunit
MAEQRGFVGLGAFRYRLGPGDQAWFLGFDPHLPVGYDLVERVRGLDAIALQHALVTGDPPPPGGPGAPYGIQARVRAEGTGTIDRLVLPRVPNVAVGTVLGEGTAIGPDADPMLAKITAWGPDPATARASLWEALHQLRIEGVPSRLEALRVAAGPSGPVANA